MTNTLSEPQRADVGHKLTDFMQEYLPAARAMEVALDSYDGQTLSLRAPLAPNINDKLTAFGGSIYCVAVMTGWGMVYLRACEAGIEPDIVVAKAEIEYLRPVHGDIHAVSIAHPEQRWDEFMRRYQERGRARIDMCAEVLADGEVAARFSGMYALLGQK